MNQFDSVISTQYLLFWCCFEDQCSKWIFLEQCPSGFDDMSWLEVYFFFLIHLRFLPNVEKLHKFV